MKKNAALREAILALHTLDQKFRELNLACDAITIDHLDEFTSLQLRLLLSTCDVEWPTVSVVGKDAAQAAAMIARHCDHDVNRQQYFLTVMQRNAGKGVDPIDLAYLMDRVNVNLGMPQEYGTQMQEIKAPHSHYGYRLTPKPLRGTHAEVDARRRAIGMCCIGQQIEDMYQTYSKKSAKRRTKI